MNTNRIPTAKTARYPARIRNSKRLLLVSAITFLTLSIAFGAGHALFALAAIALVLGVGFGFAWLCRRHPLIAWGVISFINDLLTGRRW